MPTPRPAAHLARLPAEPLTRALLPSHPTHSATAKSLYADPTRPSRVDEGMPTQSDHPACARGGRWVPQRVTRPCTRRPRSSTRLEFPWAACADSYSALQDTPHACCVSIPYRSIVLLCDMIWSRKRVSCAFWTFCICPPLRVRHVTVRRDGETYQIRVKYHWRWRPPGAPSPRACMGFAPNVPFWPFLPFLASRVQLLWRPEWRGHERESGWVCDGAAIPDSDNTAPLLF